MVRNQTYLRMKNKEDIINLLREKKRSYSELARILRLSNTAVGKIADDLIAHNIIRRESDTKGRTGITLSINADFGYVLAIDLSGKELNLCAADFESKILLRKTISEVVSFERRDFARVIETMWEMIKTPLLANKKLCCISVASPGKFSETGEIILNPRFKGFENISIRKVLSDTFMCDVIIKNDVNLAMIGEKAYGNALKNVNNALMLHVDVGTGAALMLGGSVYEGNNGYAGEIGYFKLNMLSVDSDNFENLNYSNIYDSLSLYSSLAILRRETHSGAEGYLKEYVNEHNISAYDININNVVEAYKQNDGLTRKVLNSSGRVIGSVASNITELLDIDIIVLNGAVTQLGEPFLQVVSEQLYGKTVKYATLMGNATLMGAVHVGLTKAILDNF